MKILSSIKYEYGNLKIGGGGFVTGITFHPTDSKTLYIRTDIGGIYRYDFDKQTWAYLADKVTADDPAQTYPLAIALDENDPKDTAMQRSRKRSWQSHRRQTYLQKRQAVFRLADRRNYLF